MRSVRWLSIVALTVLVIGWSCTSAPATPSPTPTPAIGEEKAIAIAATQLPLSVIERSRVYSSSSGRIIFEGANTTKEELGWEEDGKTVFDWSGSSNSPPGVYARVMIAVNVSTGEIYRRLATNGVFLAEPASLPIEPPRRGWGCTR